MERQQTKQIKKNNVFLCRKGLQTVKYIICEWNKQGQMEYKSKQEKIGTALH